MGWTPLHEAVSEDNVECISLLLEHGADIDAADSESCTCLHLAARYLNLE